MTTLRDKISDVMFNWHDHVNYDEVTELLEVFKTHTDPPVTSSDTASVNPKG